MATQSASDQLRSKAKKLEMLAGLLEDKEIASEMAGLFSPAATSEAMTVNQPVVPAKPSPVKSTPKRRIIHKRKRGLLEPKILEVIKHSANPMTTREIAEKMQADGYSFSAANPIVAVAKVLRKLAQNDKLRAQHTGNHEKSPIVYSFPAITLAHVPVRDIA